MPIEDSINPELSGILADYKQTVEVEKESTLGQRLAFQIKRSGIARLLLSGSPSSSTELLERLKELLLRPPQDYPASIIFCLVNNRNRPTFNYGFEVPVEEDQLRVRFQSPQLWIERKDIDSPIIRVQGQLPPTVLIPDNIDYAISVVKKGVGRLKWAPDVLETRPVAIMPDVDQETVWLNRKSIAVYRSTFWDRKGNFPLQSTLVVNSSGNLVPSLAITGSIEQLPANKFRRKPI